MFFKFIVYWIWNSWLRNSVIRDTNLHVLLWHPDPHVRVAGEPESVRAAKERIMAVLDTRVKMN